MAGIADDLSNIKSIVGGLSGNNKVARFAYTQAAYTNDDAAGRSSFDINADNNIPTNDASTLDTNPTVIDRGFQTQASSITRQLQNHFYGRVSYNLNKLVDKMYDTLGALSAAMGRSDSAAGDKTYIATLDANGRLPSNQLTEDAMEIRTYWDASTNTPDLTAAANKRPGNVYYVSTEGTRDIGGGSKTYYVGDVLICNKSYQWERIPVTYVKGGAENASAYRTGKADITKANVGLGNVADIDQSPALKDLTFTADASTVTVGATKLDGNSATLTGSSLPVVDATHAGIMTAAMYNQLTNMVLDFMFPVGSLYWTSNAGFNPNVTFGGTWVRLKGAFIWAADPLSDTVTPASTTDVTKQGGVTSVTLSSGNLPKHTHGLNSHTHTLSHTHSLAGSGAGATSGGSWDFKISQNYDGWSIVQGGSNVSVSASGGSYYTLNHNGTQRAMYTISGAAHTHGLTGSTGAASTDTTSGPDAFHSSTTDGGFSNTAFSVKNPYINRFCWERVPDPTPAT